MPSEPEINELARRARSGESEAFESLARLLTPLLVGFFLRKGHCDPEELTQQTWLRVVAGLASYNPQRDFKAWLFAIAYHRWVDSGRFERIRPHPMIADVAASSMDDPVSAAEFSDALGDCLEKLSEADRSALFLCYWKGKTLKKIAADREEPYGPLKARIARVRDRLRDCLQKKFP